MSTEDGSDTMSVSIEKDDSMGFFAGCYRYSLLLGFSNIKPENVLRYGKGDSATPVGKGEYDKKIEAINGEVRRYKESDGAHYDELLVSRYCDTDNIKEFRDEEKRILPDYILVFKGKSDFTHLDYDYIEKMNVLNWFKSNLLGNNINEVGEIYEKSVDCFGCDVNYNRSRILFI